MKVRFCQSLICFLALLWTSAACFAVATHELTQKFETTVSGESLVLEAGTRIEIMQLAGPTAFVKHTLPNGKTTILQIPETQIKKIQPQATATATVPSEPSVSPAPASVPPAPIVPNSIKLLTKEGKSFEGSILRVEKAVVVVHKEEDQVEDIPLPSLDEKSMDLVKTWQSQSQGKPPLPDPRVVPGKKIILTFPELGPSNQSDPARIQVRIPENYKADQPVPLALFLAGGGGSDNCDSLNGLVDPKDYVLVAFPYSKKIPSPRDAFNAGNTEGLITFQKPMLERLKALVPNSDPQHRVVIGTSNGAHMIAIGISDGWEEFGEFFSAFALHEGGGTIKGNFKPVRKKDVFVLWGDKSEFKAFAEGVAKAMEADRVKITTYAAVGEGHGMGGDARRAVKEWIEKIRLTPK